MEIFKIAGIVITSAIVALIIKPHRPEISIQIAIVAGIVVIGIIINNVSGVIDLLQNMAQKAGIQSQFLEVLIKITGIAYISEYTASLCRDSGEMALAYKMEFAGKIMIAFLAIPIFGTMMNMMIQIMP